MSELTNTNTGRIIMIEDLARQAKHYAEGTAFNMLQLGRVLTEAKALVEHGAWEDWIRENAGIDKRAAQYFMGCYKKYGTDSPLARLGASKLIALLPLPDEELEKLKEEKNLDEMSVRAIKEEVRKARAEEQQKAREAVENEHQSGLLALARERDASEKKIAEIQRQNAAGLEAETQARLFAEKRIAELESRANDVPEEVLAEIQEKEERIAELERKIKETSEAAKESYNSVMESTKDIRKEGVEAMAARDKLQREVDAKNRMLESLQAEHEKLQEELFAAQRELKKGDAERTSGDILSSEAVGDAVRLFMGQVGRIPYMHTSFSTMDAIERENYRANILQVKAWADKSLEALDTVDGIGGIVE